MIQNLALFMIILTLTTSDIATPRKLLKSRSSSSPLVYVPPLDLKRALSIESGKDKKSNAPKAANRTLAQSAFLKKLGGKSKKSPWVKRGASKNGKLLKGGDRTIRKRAASSGAVITPNQSSFLKNNMGRNQQRSNSISGFHDMHQSDNVDETTVSSVVEPLIKKNI